MEDIPSAFDPPHYYYICLTSKLPFCSFPDKVRGIFNEGGLFGERAGWHLPGYDTSPWESRDLSNGLPNSAAGAGFFVTTFELDIPAGYDVPISFVFDEPLGQPYRVYLFVNGWMMGKRVGNLGYVYLLSARIRS